MTDCEGKKKGYFGRFEPCFSHLRERGYSGFNPQLIGYMCDECVLGGDCQVQASYTELYENLMEKLDKAMAVLEKNIKSSESVWCRFANILRNRL